MRFYSNKEKKRLIEKGLPITKKDEIKEENDIIYINKIPSFIRIKNNEIEIPHLKLLNLNLEENQKEETLKKIIEKYKKYPSIYIDRGAIKFILKGADVMRPGITRYEQFKKEEIILIKDEEHKKIIAIGIAQIDSIDMEKITQGKVIKNMHYYGDKHMKEQ